MASHLNLKVVNPEIVVQKYKKKSTNIVTDFTFLDTDEVKTTIETEDSLYMPNFSKNFDELIRNIKTHKNLSNYPKIEVNTEKEKISHKSAQETSIPKDKVEKLISQTQSDELKTLTNIEEIIDFMDYTENCLKLICSLKKPVEEEIKHLFMDLPEYMTKKKKLAIFDLDETLIHCELKNPKDAQKRIKIKLPNGGTAKIGLNIRPHIIPCLEEIQKKYHTIIYTASDQSYADSVLDFIDPWKEYFKVRLYRHNCVKVISENGSIYIKDLRIIRNIPMNNMVIIDNSVLSFAFQLENGIPVLPFYSNKSDNELIYLRDYLMELHKSDNLRETNSKVFNLSKLMNETSLLDEDKSKEEENKGKGSPSDSNESDEEKDNEQVSPLAILHNKKEPISLETKLNKPVRRESKFQDALSETIQNAHINLFNAQPPPKITSKAKKKTSTLNLNNNKLEIPKAHEGNKKGKSQNKLLKVIPYEINESESLSSSNKS